MSLASAIEKHPEIVAPICEVLKIWQVCRIMRWMDWRKKLREIEENINLPLEVRAMAREKIRFFRYLEHRVTLLSIAMDLQTPQNQKDMADAKWHYLCTLE